MPSATSMRPRIIKGQAMITKTLYEIEISCDRCHAKSKIISQYAGYHYHTCKLCRNTMTKKSWNSEVKEIIQEVSK